MLSHIMYMIFLWFRLSMRISHVLAKSILSCIKKSITRIKTFYTVVPHNKLKILYECPVSPEDVKI